MAHYFTHKMIERLQDDLMREAFEALDGHLPQRYRIWHQLRDRPVEKVRKILMQARAGLDGLEGVGAAE